MNEEPKIERIEADEEKSEDKQVTIAGGQVKKFSEIYGQAIDFEGQRMEMSEAIDKEIIIYDFAILPGLYGDFVVVQAKLDEKMVNFPVGSVVILDQLKKAKQDNNLPLQTTIIERISEKSKRKYFSLS